MTNLDQSIEAPRWLAATDAIDLMARELGGFEAAQSDLIAGLHAGVIGGIAAYILQEADIGEIDFNAMDEADYRLKRHPGKPDKSFAYWYEDCEFPVHVPDNFMASEDGWTIDQSLTSWLRGYIVARRPTVLTDPNSELSDPRKLTRRIIHRIEFRRRDILRLINVEPSTPGSTTVSGTKRGRKPKETWSDWVAEVALMANAGEIGPHIGTDVLITKLADRLIRKGVDAPDRSRTYSAAQAVLRALRAEDAAD